MVAYGIGVFPLIKRLNVGYPGNTQPLYEDNAGELDTFDNIFIYFNSFKKIVPGCGYYPGPSKSILIVHPNNLTSGKEFGLRHGFKVCTGTR